VAPSGYRLLCLREELDIADAAAAKLDVVPADRDGAVTLIGMHTPLHRVDIGDGRVIEIFAPDERRKLAQELLARHGIARGDARFDQGRALPILAETFVIDQPRV